MRWPLAGRGRFLAEPASLALTALRTERVRSFLAIFGIVIGIVTVVLVASVLANVRNQIAVLFRDLGTENVFAFHLTGDPYVQPNEQEARRQPLQLEWIPDIMRLSTAIRDVGAQVIVPTTRNDEVLVARAGGNENDTVLVEGASPALFDIVGAEFARGRPFTELEDRQGAPVAIVGASLARSLFGASSPIGRTLTLAGETVHRGRRVGEAPRRLLRREPAGQRAQPASRHRAEAVRRAGARGALHARQAGSARGVLPRVGGHPAAAPAAAGRCRQRLHAVHGRFRSSPPSTASAPASASPPSVSPA